MNFCLQVFHQDEFNYGNLRWYETKAQFLQELKRLNKKYGYDNVFVIEERY